MRTLYPLLLLLLVVVITSLGHRPKRELQRRLQRDVNTPDSQRPLRRSKRRWVLTTIVLEENDPGPFPKYAGDLFNDRAENHSIRYLISGPGVDEAPEIGLFQINDFTGQVYVNRAIDREKTPLFIIRFDVADRDTGKILDRSLIFNVEVNDVNDNAPVFDKNPYDITINETINLDNSIFQVSALDHDKEDSPSSKVSYHLISQLPDIPSMRFSVDPVNGLIRGKGCLNYETANFFKLIVGARDMGADPLMGTTTVNIRVLDSNNNMPVFAANQYELSIKEGELKDEVLRLKVLDKDSPKTPAWRAVYKIFSGNEKENYKLVTDPETNDGILSIVKPLDFEGTPTKKVVIKVENVEPFYSCQNGKLKIDKTVVPNNVTLSVTVIDSNDAPIFFPPVKVIREKEGLKPGTILATFNASDPDLVPNKIRYQIAEDPAGWVTIDEKTGVLKTTQELDRESPYVNQTLYQVVVFAVDDGEPPETGSGTVLLYVSDVNDNTPQLVAPYMERCEQQSNTPFIIEATDEDLDPYAGPFTFDVAADHAKSVKETWSVKQHSDTSAEITMLKSLAHGNHSIPLEIYDRQGTFAQQVLTVRVCSCLDGETCERLAPASHQMGGGAIGAVIGALLFFLLALCFLMCFLCGSGGEKHNSFPGSDEGNQTLIQYNEEGGSALSQASPGFLMANGNGNVEFGTKASPAHLMAAGNGNIDLAAKASPGFPRANGNGNFDFGTKASPGFPRANGNGNFDFGTKASPAHLMAAGNGNIDLAAQDKDALGRSISGTFPRAQYQPWEADMVGRSPVARGQYQSYETDGRVGSATMRTGQSQAWVQGNQSMQIQNGTWHQNSKYMKNGSLKIRHDNVFVEKIGEMLSQRLHGFKGDDEISTYKPHTYAYEGDLERIDSMDSFILPDSTDFSFLDDFDPKFATLEAICKK